VAPPKMLNAVLDACILYPAPIRDLLLSFAEVGLYKPFWSEKINEEITDSLSLPDLNDRHVLATAIQCESSLIVTANLMDFPETELRSFAITAISPDNFIADLIRKNKLLACSAFENQVRRLQNPILNQLQVLETFHKLGLRITRSLLLEIDE
jgi:hypothetical protein